MSAIELSPDEKAEVARFGIHDEEPRWRVACINWPHPDAPRAMTYLLVDDAAELLRFHATWEDAIAWLDERAEHLATWAKVAATNIRRNAS